MFPDALNLITDARVVIGIDRLKLGHATPLGNHDDVTSSNVAVVHCG